MKYKVGDKVKVREDLEVGKEYNGLIYCSPMEEYKGRIGEIEFVDDDGDYLIKEFNLYYSEEMLEPVAEKNADSDENKDESIDNTVETIDKSIDQFTKEDLKFGDIVTFRGGEKRVVAGNIIINEGGYFNKTEDFDENLLNYANTVYDIMKVQRYIHYNEYVDNYFKLEILYERKEKILTEKEKEYLSAVIKPFRDRRFTISKILVYDKKTEFIFIEFSEDEYISFPYFKKGTMYKGMETNKKYTLEELGL